MTQDDLARIVGRYYQARGLKVPDTKDALIFLMTEVAEGLDALMRTESGWVRNNDRDASLPSELGDMLMMLIVASVSVGVDPVEAMFSKMRTKGFEPMGSTDA